MAYLVVYSRGQVIARQAITEELTTIGRSADCSVVIRDILLSRSHCRIDNTGNGYVVRDLHSKNGTIADGFKLDHDHPLPLHDGMKFCIGKTMILFHRGAMPPAAVSSTGQRVRAADPIESLAGTVWGMTLEQDIADLPGRFANPRPAPPLPACYEQEKIHEMLEEIASSSWDSIYAESRKPRRAGDVTADVDAPRRRPNRPTRPGGVCLSLQVNHDVLDTFKKRTRKRTRIVRALRSFQSWTLLGWLKAA